MKTDRHEDLLESWATRPHHSKRGFVKDGIIDHKRWSAATVKVLFLLKEAYSDPDNPSDWDLRVLLRENWKGPKGVLFWNCAYWAYAAQHISDTATPELPQNEQSYSQATECFLSTAVLNVKKSSGKTNSDLEEIKKYAQLDGDLLKKQIDIINPDIIICGYTWEAVQHLWPTASILYDLVFQAENKVFVDFWHPANQYPKKLNYYAISSLLRHPDVRRAIQKHKIQQPI